MQTSAHFLVGPTAVGKSSVAQWIAERGGRAILSADSMQVYRGMDIGTAKPSGAERTRVIHYGIDLTAPGVSFSVADWLAAAQAAFAAQAPGTLLVVGGTGLYMRCLIEGLRGGAAPDPVARARWQAVFENSGVAGLQEALRARQPEALAALADAQNARRLIRALELTEGGAALPERAWPARSAHVPFVGLRMEAEALKTRIESRVRAMYDHGFVAEVEGLLAGAAPLSETARQAIGYAEAIALLAGQCTREEAVMRTVQRTRQYAKRQRTWFARQASVDWIDVAPDAPVEAIGKAVLARWAELGATAVRAEG